MILSVQAVESINFDDEATAECYDIIAKRLDETQIPSTIKDLMERLMNENNGKPIGQIPATQMSKYTRPTECVGFVVDQDDTAGCKRLSDMQYISLMGAVFKTDKFIQLINAARVCDATSGE